MADTSSSTSSSSSISTSSVSSLSSSSSSSVSSSGEFHQSLYVASTLTPLHLQVFRDRDIRFDIEMHDAAGNLIEIDSTNVIRVKVGKQGTLPILDVNNQKNAAGGSQLLWGNPFVLNLRRADLCFAPGIYDLEILILDDATGEIVTSLKTGVFVLHETMGGGLAV